MRARVCVRRKGWERSLSRLHKTGLKGLPHRDRWRHLSPSLLTKANADTMWKLHGEGRDVDTAMQISRREFRGAAFYAGFRESSSSYPAIRSKPRAAGASVKTMMKKKPRQEREKGKGEDKTSTRRELRLPFYLLLLVASHPLARTSRRRKAAISSPGSCSASITRSS